MKKVLKFTTVIGFMFIAVIGMANEFKSNLVSNSKTKSLDFEFNSKSKKTSIKFIDAFNTVIYSENITDTSYKKRFDLKDLPNGLYFFKVDNAFTIVTYTIDLDESEAKIIETTEKILPVFIKKDGVMYINFLNLSKEKVSIKVYDSNNRMIFSESFKDQMIIEKAINFKKAYKDNYTVLVTDKFDEYYEDIVVGL